MQPGDLIFYPSQGRFYEDIIARVTHGPYVHVAVVADTDTIIAAETWGIKREPYPVPSSAYPLTIATPRPSSKEAVDVAFAWLNRQVGRQYGWVDILDQGLRLIGSPLYLGQLHSLDCSDLAACFAALYSNDRELMAMVLDHRQEISPNDLARYYSLIK